MSKKQIILLIFLVVAAFLAVNFVTLYQKKTKTDLQDRQGRVDLQDALRAEVVRQDQIILDSKMPVYLIKTFQDEEPEILSGEYISNDQILKNQLVFSTTDSLTDILNAYKDFGQQQEWTFDHEAKVSSAHTVLSFIIKQLGLFTVDINAQGDKTTVTITRLLVP